MSNSKLVVCRDAFGTDDELVLGNIYQIEFISGSEWCTVPLISGLRKVRKNRFSDQIPQLCIFVKNSVEFDIAKEMLVSRGYKWRGSDRDCYNVRTQSVCGDSTGLCFASVYDSKHDTGIPLYKPYDLKRVVSYELEEKVSIDIPMHSGKMTPEQLKEYIEQLKGLVK